MTKLTLREASRRLISATTKGTSELRQTPNLTPVLEAQIAALRAVSELLREQLTDTRRECDRWRQKAERLALPAPVPEPLRRRRRRWWQPAW